MLTGIPGARRDIVLLNAAAALVAAGLAGDLKEGVAMGAEAIDSGQAAATLAKLRALRRKARKKLMRARSLKQSGFELSVSGHDSGNLQSRPHAVSEVMSTGALHRLEMLVEGAVCVSARL